MPLVKVGDVNIYYESHGEGEPLVLIPGLGGNSNGWFRQIPVFSQQYRVIAFDNRGAGRSDAPDVPYTMDMMSNDLNGLLESIGIDAAHIYGISMGGMIAQHFTLNHPQKVISLILGCTACGGSHGIRLPDAEVMKADIERRQNLTPEQGLREQLPFLFSQEFINSNPEFCEQYIKKAIEFPAPLQGFIRQTEAILEHDTYERLPDIKMPTLVIAGGADMPVPVENLRLLALKIPNAELVILEGKGHCFFIEAADESNQIVLDFIKKHSRSS